MQFQNYSEVFLHYLSEDVPEKITYTINEFKSQVRVIDVGCGDGAILYGLSKSQFIDKFRVLYAVDLSPHRLAKVATISELIKIIEADATKIPIENNSVDFIISNQLIEHLENEAKFLAECYRILDNDGRLYISTVFKKWYGWYFYKNKFNNWVIDPTHVREYTNEKHLFELINENSLSILSSSKKIFWFPITDFILKRIGFANDIYINYKILNWLRKVKVPIFGYYNWEIVCMKKF